MINYKLRLFTPRSNYGTKEMAPKSQLCACSFQDSLRQKNWALEQIRKSPDTIGYMWTAENDSNTLCVGAKVFASAKKYLREKFSGCMWTWPYSTTSTHITSNTREEANYAYLLVANASCWNNDCVTCIGMNGSETDWGRRMNLDCTWEEEERAGWP